MLGQRRLQFMLAKSSHAFLQETANNPEMANEAGGLAFKVPDNCFFSFVDLATIPCKTSSKVSTIKQQVIAHLAPLYPQLCLAKLDPR